MAGRSERNPRAALGIVFLVLGILAYILGFGVSGLGLLIWMFGAPVDPQRVVLVLAIAGVALAGVLVGAAAWSGVRRRRGHSGWPIMLSALVVVIAGWVAAAIVIDQTAMLR